MPGYSFVGIRFDASQMTLHRYFLFLPWVLAMMLSVPGLSHAGDPAARTSMQLKAEHMLKFAHYIEWPADTFDNPASPIIIGVVGASILADELERISASEQIEGRPVTVKRLAAEHASGDAHIVFIGDQPGSKARTWLHATEARPILSVCDISHELAYACAIKFVQDSHRLRFDIALPVAERSGIRITAPLLTVARKVHE